MIKKTVHTFLVFCFAASSVNTGWAADSAPVSPVIVQPEGVKPPWWANARYRDLVALTIDADTMTENRSHTTLAEKYKMLTALQEQMAALNNKLEGQGTHQFNEDQKIMEGYKKSSQEQQDKINMLVDRLAQMEKRVSLAGNSGRPDEDRRVRQQQEEIASLRAQLRQWQQEQSLKQAPAQAPQPASEKADPPTVVYKERIQENPALQEKIADLLQKVDWLNQVSEAAKNKAKYYQLTSQQDKESLELLKSELENKITELKNQRRVKTDYNLKLAQQLIDLQHRQESLLQEKSKLALEQFRSFDRHFSAFEQRVANLASNRRLKDMDLSYQADAWKNELQQAQQEIDALKKQLEESISGQKDQGSLQRQIQDLKSQVQDREGRIMSMKSPRPQDNSQQLAEQQNRIDLLRRQLEGKTTESNKMTLILKEYQRKLEDKNNAYNAQAGQIAELKARVREKDTENQARDLNMAMVQQKTTDRKIKGYTDKIRDLEEQLVLARQDLGGKPSADEINFLREGLKKATEELKQNNKMLVQVQAEAQEYGKESKSQSSEIKRLKQQLQNAYEDINQKNEDLKYKNLEVIRLKERLALARKGLPRQSPVKEAPVARQAPVKEAPIVVYTKSEDTGALHKKLQQALDKVNEQGRLINVLAKKLEDCGQTVNLKKEAKSIKVCGYSNCP